MGLLKPTKTLPIPRSATIRKDVATWVDTKGERKSAPLSKNKQRILVESQYWQIRYRDENGIERRESTKVKSREAAQRILAKRESEAARAGAHGKGFAVVAEEVRNLAARSAKAARETADLIATSGKEIERGGEVASHTSEVLNTIVDQVKQTTDLIAGIAVASNEQAQGVNQVTIGLQQIDAVTQTNSASAEESASAANEMSSMAKNLRDLVAKFKLRR